MLFGYLDPGSSSVALQVIVFPLLWVVGALLVANYAKNKGQSFGVFLLIGLFLSWVIALVVVVIVDAIRSSSPAPPSSQEQR